MIAEELALKNLPFVPVEGQVIYAEPSYNKNGMISFALITNG